MKNCINCGQAMEDNSNFCTVCGAQQNFQNQQQYTAQPVQNYNQNNQYQEQQCLNSLFIRLKHERLAYKICSIVYFAIAAVFAVLSLIFLIGGISVTANSSDMEAFGGVLLLFWALYLFFFDLFAFLPLGIANAILFKKANGYMNSVYTDCSAAVTRCGSVGTIVAAGFFNTFALIFVIINFVNVRRHRATYERIAQNQQYNR